MWTDVGVAYFKLLYGKFPKGMRKTVCMYAYVFFMLGNNIKCGQGSSVGIVTGYGLDGPGIESW